MSNEIIITYETLFDILRSERDRDKLQQLEASFYTDVQSYVAEKKQILETQKGHVFLEEQQSMQQQLININKIIREIIDRREQKIVQLARDDVRTKGTLIDTSVLLAEEQELYKELVSLFKVNRDRISQILEAEKPKELKREAGQTGVRVTFLQEIAPLVGPDMETYGPYQQGEEAQLPEEVASLLIQNAQAKEL